MPVIETKAPSFPKRKIILYVILFALPTWVLLWSLTKTDANKLQNDLNLISEGKLPTDFINGYDYICFPLSNLIQSELLAESARIGFPGSAENCGEYFSPSPGLPIEVGLVRNNQIRCINIMKFSYWIKRDGPRCFAPSKLHVVKSRTAPPSQDISGRGSINNDWPHYLITEKQ
jgi:hypothetical protein